MRESGPGQAHRGHFVVKRGKFGANQRTGHKEQENDGGTAEEQDMQCMVIGQQVICSKPLSSIDIR
jgi:hypothetical protein